MVKVYFNDSYIESCGRVFGGGAFFLVLFSDGREVRVPYCLYSVREVLASVQARFVSDCSLVSVRLYGACGVPVFCVYRS